MRKILLVSLLLVGVVTAHPHRRDSSEEDSSEEDDGSRRSGCRADRIALAAGRIDTMAFRLERLASKLEKMRNKVEEVNDVDNTDHIVALGAYINRLENSVCESGEFQCGKTTQCINSLLVCDGVEDCDDGQDEGAEGTCNNIVESGAKFRGHVSWEACRANPDAEITVTISRNTLVSYFQPRLWLAASVALEYDENHNHVQSANSHEGFYNYGLRRLVLQPAEGDHIGAICDFFTDDLADCTITEVGTLKDCARVRIHRVY